MGAEECAVVKRSLTRLFILTCSSAVVWFAGFVITIVASVERSSFALWCVGAALMGLGYLGGRIVDRHPAMKEDAR